jgi:hypothetical protein
MHGGIRDAQNHFSSPNGHLYPFTLKHGGFPPIAWESSLPLSLYFLTEYSLGLAWE